MKIQENDNQLEMFSGTGKPCGQNNNLHNTFFGCLRGHEKIIILIISFIITGAISFSLGVERGKRISAFNAKDIQIEIADTKPQAAPILEQKGIFKNKDEEEKNSRLVNLPQILPVQTNNGNKTETPSEKKSRYTIQLASYKTNTTAQKEAQKLKEKGHKTLVLTKGNYIILCVGSFTDKEAAKTRLSELKKRYRDGIIRRL